MEKFIVLIVKEHLKKYNKWVYIEEKWKYWLNTYEYLKNSWLFENNKWYYLDSDGSALVGWHLINNKWYYFYSNTVMASDTWIGNYYVDSSGAW